MTEPLVQPPSEAALELARQRQAAADEEERQRRGREDFLYRQQFQLQIARGEMAPHLGWTPDVLAPRWQPSEDEA